jgi:hypothetical protein
MKIPPERRSSLMRIPIQLSFKLFNETTSIKTTVYDLHIGDTMDMYKKVMIPLFGVENYENTILQLANKIKEKRKKEPLYLKVFKWIDNLFKE